MHGRIALAGNPNSGKTTLFNALVGGHERVGNWPGTTVERKEGLLVWQGQRLVVVDLPGIYSLTAHSIDEEIARDFLLNAKPAVVVVVLDATHLERHLYLAKQIMDLGSRVILVLNKTDLLETLGIKIDVVKLAIILNVPVVSAVAVQRQGIDELKAVIARSLESAIRISGAPAVTGNVALLESEGDATQRYAYIKGVVRECVTRQLTLEERVTISDRIDVVVTNRFLGIPIFLGFMYLLFSLVFRIGDPFAHAIENGFALLGHQLAAVIVRQGLPAWFGSLLSDGILAGVGGVLVFLPYIMLLYLGISFLQQSGYLARAAFIMDRIMHALGLHGKSFIPMLLGFGCNIPGIMAARTLSSPKDRILTILVLPLMSCSARLPVYTLFAGALFPRTAGLVVFSLYLMGIVLAIVMARVLKRIFFKEESGPLVMELPPYRMPEWKQVLTQMFFQAWAFVRKAGTVIFFFVVVAWFLASLPVGVEYASEHSVIGQIGKFVAPIFAPAGFGFWQAAVALFFGVMAKEVVIGTLGTLYGVESQGLAQILPQHFTPLSGYAFLVMTALYIPCVATIATIRKETNWKWAAVATTYTLILGWLVSVFIYQLGRIFIPHS